MSSQAAVDLIPERNHAPLDLHRDLNDLHELLYRRGGIRPTNAAIEELSKLLLLVVKSADDPHYVIPGAGPLGEILEPEKLAASGGVESVKAAFRHVASLTEYAGRLPDGHRQPIWPADEPLRLGRADVLAEALAMLRRQLDAAATTGQFDLIGTAFDIFLRGRYEHAGGLGTHLTPHTIAKHLVRLCLTDLDLLSNSSPGPVCGDPCCGTGRFLVAVMQELAARRDEPGYRSFVNDGLFGADQSTSLVAKARMNLLLLGVRHPNVFAVEDSITDSHIDVLGGTLSLILTNPPFGGGKYDSATGIERTASRLEALRGRRRIDPALAFLVRCLELLADGGRLGIVLPDGLVDGPALRSALLGSGSVRWRDVSVEANISLPTATFALAGTVAKTSALVLRKGSPAPSRVFLARADHVGYLKQGSVSVPDPGGDDLPAICAAGVEALARPGPGTRPDRIEFVNRRPLAALLPAAELVTLDPARIDPGAVAARQALRSVKSFSLRAYIKSVKRPSDHVPPQAPFISVLHVDDLGAVKWHEACTYRPSTPGLVAQPYDLIVSLLNPRKLRATVIPGDLGDVLCSSEFGVFEAFDDPYAVLALLHHPLARAQLAPLGRGTSSSRRRICEDDVLDLAVPGFPPDQLAFFGCELRGALYDLRAASERAATVYRLTATAG